MIQVIAIDQQYKKHHQIQLPEVINNENYLWFWIDFNHPTEKEIQELDQTLKFHPLAIEDCIHGLQRPKLDYYDDYTFYTTHAIKQKGLHTEEIDFFIGENYIVSFHMEDSKELNHVWNRLITLGKIEQWDPHHVFYQILDKIVDNYFPLIYEIEDELNAIENNSDIRSMNILMERLFDIRHKLLTLRHTINPARDLLYRMLNSHHLEGIRDRREYFSDIYDHLLKLSEMVESNREITNDIRDSYLSLTSHQTNQVMKILTIITSIFAPITFIAGIYGMNFRYMPELTWDYGYFIILGIMGTIAVLMYTWFKRKGWF
ncbi:magnesium/cobalt transporter CorA [Aquibacillus sp. 3ASR75-11]|uniref:Magnesium transport protein CorA n=1 Tax=Terrihalobacillus insolitus TaxID=2950438 RepID=A0A9X3WP85_9BACI|nr:magnesium/cobalt transporter CorA [Terrihalobacillus insolitus]MDC3412010.1 magnesium/cobalt transporter CorA [Terrihalobacillus insolitus]MDC3423305.1 magnesium/cobalt transporter CorA [Terrihalobacillus insolitus]